MKTSTNALLFCFFAGMVGYGLAPLFTNDRIDMVFFIGGLVCLAAAGVNEWRDG